MNVYVYSYSGHQYELNRLRRCACICKNLAEFKPLLCTSDFRAGAYAKDNLGLEKYVNIDVIQNLATMMEKNDILIYDSDEAGKELEDEIKEFTSICLKVGVDIPYELIDTSIFCENQKNKNKKNNKKQSETALFFGDSNNENLLEKLCKKPSKQKYDIPLLMGHYFYLGSEKDFSEFFDKIIDEEEYINTILNTKFLLTTNENAVLESLNCGNCPVLFLRPDIDYKFLSAIKEANIPIIVQKELGDVIDKFKIIIINYPKIKKLKHFDFAKIKEKIQIQKNNF